MDSAALEAVSKAFYAQHGKLMGLQEGECVRCAPCLDSVQINLKAPGPRRPVNAVTALPRTKRDSNRAGRKRTALDRIDA